MNARSPMMCVTVLASQPSESMPTEITFWICSPGWPGLPTVSTIRRSSSACSRLGQLALDWCGLVVIRLRHSSSGASQRRSRLLLRLGLVQHFGVDVQRRAPGRTVRRCESAS